MDWQVRGRKRQSYGFTYDYSGRILSARYGQFDYQQQEQPPTGPQPGDPAPLTNNESTGGSDMTAMSVGDPQQLNTSSQIEWIYFNYYDTDYTYDARGNITGLTRRGKSASDCKGSAVIDKLTYNYTNSAGAITNQLQKVTEGSTAPAAVAKMGFIGTSSYTYDKNGNLSTDTKKGLTLSYNHLNLPKSIVRSGQSTITYTYTADGRKLKQQQTGLSREYFDGIEYVDGKLSAVYFEHGRVNYDASLTKGR